MYTTSRWGKVIARVIGVHKQKYSTLSRVFQHLLVGVYTYMVKYLFCLLVNVTSKYMRQHADL